MIFLSKNISYSVMKADVTFQWTAVSAYISRNYSISSGGYTPTANEKALMHACMGLVIIPHQAVVSVKVILQEKYSM